jgi:hypothetical protein
MPIHTQEVVAMKMLMMVASLKHGTWVVLLTGAMGPAGTRGPAGSWGPRGFPGPTGRHGDKGYRGDEGECTCSQDI